MEVAIGLLAVAFGHDRLEGGGRLLEGGARLGWVAAQLAEAKAEPEKHVAVGMQIVAELRRKGRRVGRKRAVAPDDRARLAACDQPAAKSGGRRFCRYRRRLLQALLALAITRS